MIFNCDHVQSVPPISSKYHLAGGGSYIKSVQGRIHSKRLLSHYLHLARVNGSKSVVWCTVRSGVVCSPYWIMIELQDVLFLMMSSI